MGAASPPAKPGHVRRCYTHLTAPPCSLDGGGASPSPGAPLRAAIVGGADTSARRVRWTDDLDAAACVMIVLSAGVLRPGSPSGDAVEQALRRDLPLVFVYSPADPSEGGWDFRGPDFYEARDEVKTAINSHEALVYRPPSSGYEHAAMANEVVWRLARAARKNEAAAATRAVARSPNARSGAAPVDDARPVAAAPPVPLAESKPAVTPAQLRVETLEAALAAERERTARLELALAAAQAENQALRVQYKVA